MGLNFGPGLLTVDICLTHVAGQQLAPFNSEDEVRAVPLWHIFIILYSQERLRWPPGNPAQFSGFSGLQNEQRVEILFLLLWPFVIAIAANQSNRSRAICLMSCCHRLQVASSQPASEW